MTERQKILSVRLSDADWLLLDRISHKHGYSRSHAARVSLSMGLQFADAGHSFNLTRVILLLEYTQAAIDVIITRDHGDFVPQLLEAAKQRLETYHAD